MGNQKYEVKEKEEVLRQYLEEGRSKKSLTDEYKLGQGTINYWLKQYRKECQENPEMQAKDAASSEIRKLRKELAEAKKENEFLKKAAAFFAKEIE